MGVLSPGLSWLEVWSMGWEGYWGVLSPALSWPGAVVHGAGRILGVLSPAFLCYIWASSIMCNACPRWEMDSFKSL